MKLFISTSILGLLAISAAAGVMPEDIQATTSALADTYEVASGTEVMNDHPKSSFMEQLDEFIQFAFSAIFILL